MVLQHMSSKDIARELKISPHTVDQRIRIAMGHLGATSRVEAAKLLAAHENTDPYQSFIYQPPDIVDAAPIPDTEDALRCGEQSDGLTYSTAATAEARSTDLVEAVAPYQRDRWPFPIVEGQVNTLAPTERLGWIVIIAIGSALAFGMILAGMDALSRLV
jgi:hypothetical protein